MMNLKRTIVALALALAIGVQAHAGVGVHGGLNLADVSTSSGLPTVSTTEWMSGAFYETDGTLFHFQPELNYVKKGVANYLEVPLLLKAKIETPVVSPYLMVGPAVGLKLEGAGAKTIDLSIAAGGGVEIAIAPTLSLLVEGRYSLGLVNVNDLSAVDVKTRGIHILAGLHFAL